MSAVSLTINALLAQSTVTALVSTRIRPFPLPQGDALPAIAVAMSAENEEYLLGGASQYPEATVQIHCIALSASAAIEIGERVKQTLRDLHWTGTNSPPTDDAWFTKEPVDFTDFADDLSTYRRVMSFAVRWR